MGRAARRFWAGWTFWSVLRRQRRPEDAELVSAPRREPAASDSSGPGRRGAHHQRRLARAHQGNLSQRAADADSVLSRPADGGSFSARAENRYSRSVYTRGGQGARGLFSLGYRPDFLGSALGRSFETA